MIIKNTLNIYAFFIIYYFSETYNTKKIITQNYEHSLGYYKTQIFYPSITAYLQVNLYRNYTLLCYYPNKKCGSTKYVPVFDHDTTDYFARECVGEPKLSNENQIHNFHFYLLGEPFPTGAMFFLGLSSRFFNESYSLVHQMKKEKYIDELSFGFVPNNKYEGLIYYGGIPEHLNKMKKHECKINSFFDNWNCQIDKIIIGNNEYLTKNYHSYFNTNHQISFIPLNFFEYLQKTIFYDLVVKNQCELKQNQDISFIKCKTDIASSSSLSNIIISFKNFSLPYLNPFICKDNEYCDFAFQYDANKKDLFIIGASFLKYYNVFFNYETQSISFYTEQGVLFCKVVIKELFIFLSILNIIMIVLLLYIYKVQIK